MSQTVFPKDFMWGAACSAMQLEGGRHEGGKTDNIREHAFYDPATSNKYEDHFPPDIGADFYHKYPEDIKLMKELGIKTFRFTIAWARICPDKSCTPNQAGIDYYSSMIDMLIENGIMPFFDLLHSDLPQWVFEEGGFPSEKFIEYFSRYAEICFREFGSRVPYWCTVNEPKLIVYGAYAHAHGTPYLWDKALAMKATKNMILAHFEAVKILRKICPNAKIGSIHNAGACYPVSDDPADISAAKLHSEMQHLFLSPMMTGRYPDLVLQSDLAEYIHEDDIRQISEAFIPMDFYGINYYCPSFIQAEENTKKKGPYQHGLPVDAYGFTTYAPGLFDTLQDMNLHYPGKEVLITENGYTYKRNLPDFSVTGSLHDIERIDYIRQHVEQCERAVQAGIDLTGYFYWSIMDCWEGSMGYGYPMGLIAVNFETLERVPRESFYYYQKLIREKTAE